MKQLFLKKDKNSAFNRIPQIFLDFCHTELYTAEQLFKVADTAAVNGRFFLGGGGGVSWGRMGGGEEGEDF